MSAVPHVSHLLVLATVASLSGALLSWMGWPQPGRGGEFAVVLLAAMLTSLPAVQAADRDWTALRLPFVAELAALTLFGPAALLCVAAGGLLVRAVLEGERAPRWWTRLAEAAAILLALLAAAWAYRACGGAAAPLTWPGHALPLLAAALAYCIVSATADLTLPFLRGGALAELWLEWRARVRRACPVYVVAASVAAAAAEMLARQQWSLLLVTAAPLSLAYRVYASQLRHLDAEARRGRTPEAAVTALAREASEDARADEAQRQREGLELAAEAANDGLWEWDLATEQFAVTGRWKAMLGLPADAAISGPAAWLARVHDDDIGPLKEALQAHLAGQTPRFQHEHRIRHEDGTFRFFQCRGVTAATGLRIAGSLTDTTDLAVTQERLRDAVFLDPLTGLCNRAVFVEELGRRLKEFKRRRGRDPFALLYLDLDRFKVVNDSLGHLVGDELLVAVSRRLESCLRDGDVLARLGGDEFAILLNGLQTAQQANVVAFRVQEAMSKPFSIGGREVFTSVSIGIAFGLTQYSTPDEIMHDADTAMYQAKAHGKARHEVFDADMDARARDRLGLENDLRRAIAANALEVHYQPIVALASARCVAFESLVRWSRNGKPVSPALFIPIAEELGLIETLGTRVLEEACRTFAGWQRAFPGAGLDGITVNVSCRQLMQHNFVAVVEQAVRQARLKPSALRIEITETALMTNPDAAARVLSSLRRFGVKIYLDDFGTGYSSLSHLHKLPVDALKIDRSFVRSLSLPDRPAIVESILALARTLETSVVAEGIETETQARELARLGCTHAQGYFFSRPVPAAEVEQLLLANRPLGPTGAEQAASVAVC